MLRNTVYMGEHVFKSKYGTITREVPALVDRDTFTRACAQVAKNKSLPKGNATRTYLLRGLVTCGICGMKYVGVPGPYTAVNGSRTHYYRCGSQLATQHPDVSTRCKGKLLRAEWIENLVWERCREFILNPGEALAEAQQQLHDRMGQAARMEDERARLNSQLGAKATERERVLTLFRRGRITLEDAEKELDTIGQEEATIRQHLAAIEAQQALADTYEAHYTEASILLTQLQQRLEAIEATRDVATKRQVIELLVAGLRVDTEGSGRHKRATVTVTYRFAPKRVVDATTREGLFMSRS